MNILVTAIGSFSADYVISSLKKHQHFVVGCDIYPSIWHAVSKDCDAVYQVPLSSAQDKYIHALLEICVKHHVDYIFPLTDVEVDVLNIHRKTFDHAGVKLCIQDTEMLRIARDKYETCRLFASDDKVNVPQFALSSELSTLFPLPGIAKPVNGRSSEGLLVIDCVEELMQLKSKPGYIVQEKLSGPVFTVDYVRNAACDKDVAIPREELLRTKNGAGTTVKISDDPRLQEVVSYIGNKLNVNGCINMEFILHEDKYYLIDINPRFSAGVAFSGVMGYDMVQAHLSCFKGEEILPAPSLSPVIITKRYKEEIII